MTPIFALTFAMTGYDYVRERESGTSNRPKIQPFECQFRINLSARLILLNYT